MRTYRRFWIIFVFHLLRAADVQGFSDNKRKRKHRNSSLVKTHRFWDYVANAYDDDVYMYQNDLRPNLRSSHAINFNQIKGEFIETHDARTDSTIINSNRTCYFRTFACEIWRAVRHLRSLVQFDLRNRSIHTTHCVCMNAHKWQ